MTGLLDIPFNYNHLYFLQQTYLVPLWKKNEYIVKENLSLVAYVQSSCDTPSGRDEYVSELMKHIKVDSYGHCLHNTDLPSSLRNPTVNNFSIFLKIRHKILKFFNANIFQRFYRRWVTNILSNNLTQSNALKYLTFNLCLGTILMSAKGLGGWRQKNSTFC